MTSTENNPPSPQLKNYSENGDDSSSQNLSLPFPEVEQPVQHPTGDGGPKLSKFSIRDYVFAARSKDIKTNWPFPHKTLQHCLDHGVKELLPPFQSREELRNQSSRGTSFVEGKTSGIDAC